jgi:hypothetical protein
MQGRFQGSVPISAAPMASLDECLSNNALLIHPIAVSSSAGHFWLA